MKTKLIFLVLLMACFSCETSKTLSDAEKEKIKGEVKEVINTFIKGCEEADFNKAMQQWLDSPDLIYMNNGYVLNYKGLVDGMEPLFKTLLNQKITIVDEKYAFPDNSTVIYTLKTKWLMNFKDGHSTLEDPTVMSIIYKKINNTWKAIYCAESGNAKSVPSETSKELNQVELLKKFVGNWKCDIAKDTTAFYEGKPYGTGLDCSFKSITKGKVVMEGKQLRGYDKNIDKFIFSGMMKGTDLNFFAAWFISKNKYLFVPYSDITNLEKASWKVEGEFKSPDVIFETYIVNDKSVKTDTWTRVKK